MKQGYPDGCIHELFAEQVARTPGRVALIAGNECVTFGELDARANQVARCLIARGVRREMFVGICLERSAEAIVALIGVLKAGAAYVYLDPSYPARRLLEMAHDSAIRSVITDRTLGGRIFGGNRSVKLLFPDSADIAQHETTDPGATVGLDDAAYLVYTSGSTGQPKGAVEVHRSMTSRLISVPLPDIQPADRCCLSSSLSFGISASRLFFPLVQGAPVVVLDEGSVRDVGRFVSAIDAHRITSVFMVPALLREVLRLLEQGGCRLTTLRAVTVSGGVLVPDLIDRFRRALPETLLINIYGSTEIGTTAAMRVIGASAPSGPQSIGKPVANTKIYILQDGLDPAPPGASGEICVAAEHLAREYLNQPRLTAERFPANPFAEKTRERLCRTGDLGRYLPDGEIEFLGRADHQVKIRGYRIELGEIESVLLRHPAVQDAVVVAHGAEEDKRLVAYLVSADAVPPGASELRRFAADRLPDYMLPAAFLMLPQLPLTNAGKVDRAALPEPSPSGTAAEDGWPETAIERSVAQLWSELLQVERISVHDNFIELGGDSLAASRMLAAIHGEFGADIPARLAFDGTLREFARQIHRLAAGAG
jgi:amino acid adenylation domain-containing protein